MDINEGDIITFPKGILGFEELKQYILLNLDTESPFGYLQSIEDPDLTFVVVDPVAIWPDYQVEVPSQEIAELEIESPDDVAVLSIVTIPADPKQMTANLQGPVLVNIKNRKGKQVVLSGDGYTTRHRIFPDERTSQSA